MDIDGDVQILDEHSSKAVGSLVIEEIKVNENPSFLQYLASGWEINLSGAIDYTASNKQYTDPQSLHYLGSVNQYEQAIKAVGSILENYDSDKKFPIYGFGGKARYMNH